MGMFDRALEGFLRDSHGERTWEEILVAARLCPEDLLSLDFSGRTRARRLVLIAARRLQKTPGDFLEDLGAWLVRIEPIRRLLRFSGPNYEAFILSLGELPARARMVLPDMPEVSISVRQRGPCSFAILSRHCPRGWLHVLAGALRGMADDYGTLALISITGEAIILGIAHESHFASRPFALSSRAVEDGGT